MEENSMFPDVLQVTEGRQYRERGQLHIKPIYVRWMKTGN